MRKLSNDKSTGIKIKHFPLKLEMKNYKIMYKTSCSNVFLAAESFYTAKGESLY